MTRGEGKTNPINRTELLREESQPRVYQEEERFKFRTETGK